MKHLSAIVFSLFFLYSASTTAQDKNFTQFYAAPLTLNPALTGAFDGQYRLSTIYRDQWRGVLDAPFKTFATALDFRFPFSLRGRPEKDALGVGVLFYNDNVPFFDFSTTQISVSATYHKALSSLNNQFLSLGFQAGIAQRRVNFENLNFDDQFNGETGYTEPTREELPINNFAHPDFSVGLNYTYTPKSRMSFFAGGALHHFLQPEVTFYRDQPTESRNGSSQLYMKITGHLSAQLPLANQLQLLPRVMYNQQGPLRELNAGSNLRFALNDHNGMALHLGTWARTVRNTSGFGLDSWILLTGLELDNFLIGMSYDANVNSLTNGRRQGTFEISIAYLGNYDNDLILCPKF